MSDLPQKGPTLDRLVRITIGGDLAVSGGSIPAANIPIGLDGMSLKAKRAYSFKKLYSAYHGPCAHVIWQNGSDNPQTDIGFVDGVIDISAILTLTRGSNLGTVYVSTWYDQSGNGQNATGEIGVGSPALWAAGVLNLINDNLYGYNQAGALFFDNTDAAQENWTTASVFTTVSTLENDHWFQMCGFVYHDSPGSANDFGVGCLSGKLTIGLGPADTTTVRSTTTINDGVPHFGISTRNNGNGTCVLYVDSALANGSGVLGVGPRTDALTAEIGSFEAPLPGTFNVAEIIVWDDIVSDSDRQLLVAWESQYI